MFDYPIGFLVLTASVVLSALVAKSDMKAPAVCNRRCISDTSAFNRSSCRFNWSRGALLCLP